MFSGFIAHYFQFVTVAGNYIGTLAVPFPS